MKNIKESFDKLKASEELKEKTYLKMKTNIKKNYSINKRIFISLSFALASILIIFLIYNDSDVPSNNNGDTMIRFMETKESSLDSLYYNDYLYTIDESEININMLDKKIGILKQTNDDLVNDFDSNNHDGASLYTVKNIKDKLAVLDKDTLFIFKRVSR